MVFQVIEGEEEGEDSLLQRIKKEPGEVEEGYEDTSTIQIRVNSTSAPHQRENEEPSVTVSGYLCLPIMSAYI